MRQQHSDADGAAAGVRPPRTAVSRRRRAQFCAAVLLPLTAAWRLTAQDAAPAAPVRVSLADAVATARLRNLDVSLARERITQARGETKTARSALLPKLRSDTAASRQQRAIAEVGISRETTFTSTATGPHGEEIPVSVETVPPDVVGPFNLYSARAFLQVPLLDVETYDRYRATKAGEAVCEFDADAASDEAGTQAALQYLGALLCRESARTCEMKVDLSERRVRLQEDRLAKGVVTALDVKKERLSLSKARNQLITARRDLARSLINLKRAMGIDTGADVQLTDSLSHSPVAVPSVADAVAQAVAARSDYKAARQNEVVARLELDAARAAAAPSLDAGANYGRAGEELGETDSVWFMGLTLSVPLWDSWERRGRIEQRESELAQAQNRTQDLTQSIEHEIRTLSEDFRCEADAIAVAAESVAVAEDILEDQRGREKSGQATALDVLAAEVDLADARFLRTQKIYDYAVTRAKWLRATGCASRLGGI